MKSRGRRLLAPATVAPDELGKGLGFRHLRYDGYLFDEFGGSSEGLQIYSRALERLLPMPAFKGRAFHAWTYALYDLMTYQGGAPGREFVRTLQKFDSPVQWECYLDSQRTELAAWHHIHDKIVGEALAAEQASPGIVPSLIVAPYAYVTAGPPWLTVTQPGYDTRTYLEMQIRTVATDPAFAGVRGLGVFRSTYADEETVRWTACLYRHYAIEGHTDPLGSDPYLLTHIRDGDFEEQGRRWQVKPAEEGSIEFALHHQLGSTQGRYTGNQGDTVLLTRRSAKAPNVFSQEIRDLEPGRLYSFRMFSADHKDLSIQGKHAVRIDFENAEPVPEKSFSHVGQGRRENAYLNWHVRVFRAKSKTATLRISDWIDGKGPGGPIGQELMYNFIKVQPYWEE